MSRKVSQSQNEQLKSNGAGAAAGSADSGQVAVLAYELWLGRGCPIGSPEVDWFRAEEMLRDAGESAQERVLSLSATSGA